MRFGLVLSEVGQGFRRNLSMVISVILVTFISLTFLGAAILLQFQINQIKGYWYDRAQVAVYFCTDVSPEAYCNGTEASDDQIAAVKSQLEGSTLKPYIKQVTFENHKQAYADFKKQFAGSSLAELATPDILSQTFRVNMKDPSQADIVIEQLSGKPGVETVEDQRALLDPIFSIMNAASYTAIGIAALMLIAAVLLISTTIRLSAFSRRRELGIMRLVGASNRFIETPFILEGVLAALIGSLLAGGAIVAIVQFFVQGYLQKNIADTAFVGLPDALIVAPILLVVGALLAALSASVAIRRYLKV
ncbi:MAG TPA: permease-like cell division protein FtsX [Pseudolysinimonas sp.]